MDTKTLRDFLTAVKGSAAEAAALISPSDHYPQVVSQVAEEGFAVSKRYEEALGLLAQGRSIAVTVDQELPWDLYDLVRQFCHRRGIIQVLPKVESKTPLMQLDTERTKVLIVLSKDYEERNRQRYPELFSFVGAVERL
jgi:hypothetical protein